MVLVKVEVEVVMAGERKVLVLLGWKIPGWVMLGSD